MNQKVTVYTSKKTIAVGDDYLKFDFIVPDVFPENFYYLLWWDEKHSYFTIENGDVNVQTEHVLEPTEDNYQKYVQPFVDQWEVEKVRVQPELDLTQAKVERSEAVERITVEVDGMMFDGDETSQGRMARSAVAMTDEETIVWVLHDNTIAQVTKAQLLQALRLSGEEQTRLWTMPYEVKTNE